MTQPVDFTNNRVEDDVPLLADSLSENVKKDRWAVNLFGFHFGGFFHLIFWVVCLMLLFTLFRALFANKQHNTIAPAKSSSALSILEERYASGEINQEEFLQKKKDLDK